MRKIAFLFFILLAITTAPRSADASAVVFDSISGASGAGVQTMDGTNWVGQTFSIAGSKRIDLIEAQFYCENQSAAGTANMAIYRADGSLVKQFGSFTVPRSDVGQITSVATGTVLTAGDYFIGFKKLSGSCAFGIREQTSPDDTGHYIVYNGSGSIPLGSGTDVRVRLSGDDAYPSTITPNLTGGTLTDGVIDLGGSYQFSDPTLQYGWIVAHVTATSSTLGQFTNEYFAPVTRLDEFATSTFEITTGVYPNGEYWVSWYFTTDQRQKYNDTLTGPVDFAINDADQSNIGVTVIPDDGYSGLVFNPAPTSTAPVYCESGAQWEQWYCALKMGITESVRYLFAPTQATADAFNSVWGMTQTIFPLSWFMETYRIVSTEPAGAVADVTLAIPMPTGNGTSTATTTIFSLNDGLDLIGGEAVGTFRTVSTFFEYLIFLSFIIFRFRTAFNMDA